MRVANVYEMASYTLRLLKKIAARLRGEVLFIAKGGGEKFSHRENEISLTSARPDLRITPADTRIIGFGAVIVMINTW